MAAENRTLSGTDESAQAALDAVNATVPVLWEQMHPLWKRWSLDPNVEGAPNGALLKQGVRSKVHTEVDGAEEYRWVTDFVVNNASGRADQAASFLSQGNAVTQTLMAAHWPGRLYQSWRGVGFQDTLQIRGDAAKFNYVETKVKGSVMSLSRQLALAIWGFGFVTPAGYETADQAVASMQGIGLAASVTNSALRGAATSITEGYYGGINRITAANADWRGNQTTISAPLQPQNLLQALLSCTDGSDAPTLGVCGSSVYSIMWSWYEAKQRVLNNNDPTLGRAAPLSFDGISVLRDSTLDMGQLAVGANGIFMVSATGITIAEMATHYGNAFYWLNENYWKLVTWKDGAGKGGSPIMLPDFRSTTNLNRVYVHAWFGTLACGRPDRQAMLVSIDA